jgi:hypothetical protein
MSADYIGQCPRCLEEADKVQLAKDEALRRQLDEVRTFTPELTDVIDLLEQAIEQNEAPEVKETFREYYEFYGADQGTVHWDFQGTCTVCELTVSFEGSHPFYERKA